MSRDKHATGDVAATEPHASSTDTEDGDSPSAGHPGHIGLLTLPSSAHAGHGGDSTGSDAPGGLHFEQHAQFVFVPKGSDSVFDDFRPGCLPQPAHDALHGAASTASGAFNGGNAELTWSYNAVSGLQIHAGAGYLQTAEGNGGFTLDVATNGSWELHFSGSGDRIGSGFHAGWMEHGPSAALNEPPGPPPAGDTLVQFTAPGSYDVSAGHEDVQGSAGRDVFFGGIDDYMNGGGGLNCAAYNGPQAVLIDLQHGHGYGGNAESDSYVNMEQGRGAAQGSVLIGNADGSDLKSGGADSVLISTGGTGPNAIGVTDELRPDGPNCLLVSTAGADNVVFDPAHGWRLGDTETMLGFNAAHGDALNLTAAQTNWVSGTSNITDYVKLVDESDGTHVLFSPDGHVATNGVELVDLKLDHGLDLHQLYTGHNIVI